MKSKFFLLFICWFCIKMQASATTYYVTPTGDSTKTGLSWSSPLDLTTALKKAVAKDVIWVKMGTYLPSAKTKNVAFILGTGVALYGGFAGTETTLAQRNAAVNITILSGNIGSSTVKTDNAYTILSITNAAATTIVDGFTFSGAYSTGNNGGALYLAAISKKTSSPQISNCIFSGNYAQNGAGIYSTATSGSVNSPIVTNCSFINDSATEDAGAIAFLPTGEGETDGKFTNCNFMSNSAASNGGAIYMDAGVSGTIKPQFTDCIFRANTAAYGSAIANFGNNGLVNYKITNCLFSGNAASYQGTIYNSGDFDSSDFTEMTMTNCTFSGNIAPSGAAVYNYAIYGTVKSNIYNSILWDGQANEIYNIGLAYVSVVTYSDTYGGVLTGKGNISADPQFISATAYTAAPDTTGNYHVVTTSPVINAGLNSYNTTITDLGGNVRIQNATIDMGAYETAAPANLGYELANEIKKTILLPKS